MAIVYDRLKKEFEELQVNGHDLIGSMIMKTSSLDQKMYDEIYQDDGEEKMELDTPYDGRLGDDEVGKLDDEEPDFEDF